MQTIIHETTMKMHINVPVKEGKLCDNLQTSNQV